MHFKTYKDQIGRWRWALFGADNRQIAVSGETFRNQADAEQGIALVRSAHEAPVRA
ncbi:DUF1508 domain-containing protein [Azospirillum sp. SYSU D00513]|uniref:YegP family protein n=1 Tax=Azospirillum sp. SYSU D00513 TaxID=2812561 RepID=UPI001A97296B|nr:DUF1508 domain-containing protein [Azospirillum sp. SYSU D00513]